jgi:hypothetical protein
MLVVSVSQFVSFALVMPHSFHVFLSHAKKAAGQLRDFQDYAGPKAHALPAFPDPGDLLSLSELTGYEQRAKRLVLILSGCYSESTLRCNGYIMRCSRRGHANEITHNSAHCNSSSDAVAGAHAQSDRQQFSPWQRVETMQSPGSLPM